MSINKVNKRNSALRFLNKVHDFMDSIGFLHQNNRI